MFFHMKKKQFINLIKLLSSIIYLNFYKIKIPAILILYITNDYILSSICEMKLDQI
jgi:hypothetical protein